MFFRRSSEKSSIFHHLSNHLSIQMRKIENRFLQQELPRLSRGISRASHGVEVARAVSREPMEVQELNMVTGMQKAVTPVTERFDTDVIDFFYWYDLIWFNMNYNYILMLYIWVILMSYMDEIWVFMSLCDFLWLMRTSRASLWRRFCSDAPGQAWQRLKAKVSYEETLKAVKDFNSKNRPLATTTRREG